MKIHLPWIRVTAAAVLVAGVGVHEAAAQYAPYRPIPHSNRPHRPHGRNRLHQSQPLSKPIRHRVHGLPHTAGQHRLHGLRRTGSRRRPTRSPTGAQYTQPTAAYPQYPQLTQQYPANYGAYPYVAQQPTPEAMPAPKNTSAAQPSPTPRCRRPPAACRLS